MNPKFQISPSKLLVAHCGRALGLREKKVKPDTPEWDVTTFGKETHDVFHEINTCDSPMDDDILDFFIAKFVSQDHEEVRRTAVRYLEKFPYRDVTMSEYCFGVNEHFEETSYDTGIWRGRIDTVFFDSPHSATILDHKSMWQVINPNTFQLRYYAWALNKCFPWLDEIKIGIHFLRYGEIKTTDYPLTRRDFNNIERSVVAASEQAWASDLVTPIPGEYCKFCDYAMSCPVADNNISVIVNERQAVAAAEKLLVLERQSSVLKDKLKEYAKDKGNIEMRDGGCYGYVASTRRKYDVEECLDIVQRGGKLADEVRRAISISATRIKSKEIPVHLIPTTRFGYKKAKDDGEEYEG